MYREPCCKIVIGNLQFTSVHKVEIEESVKELGNHATITLPKNYEKLKGKGILEIMKTGDKVSISLGYDGNLTEEFSGYLQAIEGEAPLVLHVDDELYLLKRNNLTKAYKAGVTLKQVLQDIAPGYQISCPDVVLGSYQISSASSYRVLQALNQQFGFYSWISGKTLSCLWPYKIGKSLTGNIVTYTYYTPTVKKSNLKYHRAEDVKLHVRVISKQRDGKVLKYETGSKEKESALKEIRLPAGMDLAHLKDIAEQNYKQNSFDGFSGTITGFGYPVTHAGDTIKIVDSENADRQGSYLVESCRITYDLETGFERDNTLSFKV